MTKKNYFQISNHLNLIFQMKRRGNISLKLIADMCVKSGFDHLLTVDLHSKESQGFFGCRMDNLRAAPFFLQYVIENIPDIKMQSL